MARSEWSRIVFHPAARFLVRCAVLCAVRLADPDGRARPDFTVGVGERCCPG
ncbi:hypothetical protein YT1_0348 [Rhodococcus ruber]|nr:hypothetical protein YT1_0348 [Rhodococcus ruber]